MAKNSTGRFPPQSQALTAAAGEAALRGKLVAVLPLAAYGGYKDVNEA